MDLTPLRAFPETVVWTANTTNFAMSYYDTSALIPISSTVPAYEAVVQTGVSNFGSRFYKRVIRAFVYAFTRVKLKLTVHADGRDQQYDEDYEVASNQHLNTSESQRVKIAKGIQGDNWAFEITNPEGKFFQLQKLELVVVPIRISHG